MKAIGRVTPYSGTERIGDPTYCVGVLRGLSIVAPETALRPPSLAFDRLLIEWLEEGEVIFSLWHNFGAPVVPDGQEITVSGFDVTVS